MPRIARYELGPILGAGGSGSVYEAVLQGPGGFRKPVALKVLHEPDGGLVREARIGGLLRHRNLVDVYEIGQADGQWFCAMELCEGSLEGRAPLPPGAVVEVGLQVCAALQYAHEELGLVHLDLKPANLLFTRAGVVKVADLGIARVEGFTGDGKTRGTPGYMAPEQALGGEVDARADIYALGVTLVELATGERPRASQTLDLDDLDRAPEAAPEAIPDWLAPIVDRCLEPRPEDRWPDMAGIAERLRALPASGEGLAATLGSTPAPPPTPGELRPEVDRFVGRSADLERVVDHLDTPGILTLKGPAGIGKSRLATAAARLVSSRAGASVRACDLSEARTADGLRFAVARALGLQAAHSSDRAMGQAIAARGRLVLLLDNIDPIVGSASVLEDWLAAAPEARLLVTSREPLGVPSETVVELGPMEPDSAVALVIERARARGVEARDDARLRELVDRLDRLPLALELAAGRLGVLSVDDVLDRLGLSLLRDASEGRHGTLRAALDWSFGLLSGVEREALAQLSVFSGGFELEAAEAILEIDGPILDAVDGLVRRSMVRDAADGRFELSPSVQAFAAEHRTGTDVLRRHGLAFARLADPDALEALDGPDGAALRRALSREVDNLVAACRRAIRMGDADIAARTLRAAWRVFDTQGPYEIAAELGEAVLELTELPTSDRVRILFLTSAAVDRSGRAEDAARLAEEALQLAEERGPPELAAAAIHRVAQLVYKRGELERARVLMEAARAGLREGGDRPEYANLLANLGCVLRDLGLPEEAEATYAEALSLQRQRGDERQEGVLLGNLAILLRQQGRTDRALSCYQRVLELHRAVGDRASEGTTRGSLAVLYQHLGRDDEAMAEYQEALRLHRELGDVRFQGVALGNIATLLHSQDRLDEAREHYAAAAEALREAGDYRYQGHVLANLANLALDEGRLDDAHTQAVATLEVARRVKDPRLEGYVLGRIAQVALERDDLAAAEEALARGEHLLRKIHGGEVLAELLAVRAGLAARAGDPEMSEALLAEAHALAPESPDVIRSIERVRQHSTEGRDE